jgi:hypothetical protein
MRLVDAMHHEELWQSNHGAQSDVINVEGDGNDLLEQTGPLLLSPDAAVERLQHLRSATHSLGT